MNHSEPVVNETADPEGIESILDTLNRAGDAAPDSSEAMPDRKDWQVWPPSPKVQIVLIAMAFGAFNLILLAIWAIVMVYRF